MSEPLVIIGNGMSAARLVDELAKRGLGRHAIAVVGEEPRLAYNRVLLSSVLAGEIAADDIDLRTAEWWRDRGVTLLYGRRAVAVDPAAGRVILAGGTALAYSKLVFATGSKSIRPSVPGIDLPGVRTFRDASDAADIGAAGGEGKHAVVVGGGLLGIEAAYGLAKGGAEVTLVHLMDRLMERQLDAPAAALLAKKLADHGVTVLLTAETARIEGESTVCAVVLKDGRTLSADMVVVAIGIRPAVELARGAGLAVNRGILVGDTLESSIQGVFAIGECAEHRGICYGLVEPGYDQARVLADRLCGGSSTYSGSILATNLKVSGVNVFSVGDYLGGPGNDSAVFTDARSGIYKKLVIAEGRLAGAVLIGDTLDARWYLELARSGADVTAFRDLLMFGRAASERKAA